MEKKFKNLNYFPAIVHNYFSNGYSLKEEVKIYFYPSDHVYLQQEYYKFKKGKKEFNVKFFIAKHGNLHKIKITIPHELEVNDGGLFEKMNEKRTKLLEQMK